MEGRFEGPEGRVVRGAPGPVQLGVRPERGNGHPVEGEQGPDDEHRQRDVKEYPLLPPPFDHAYAPSNRRRYRSWIQPTMSSPGNMKSEMAPPPPSRPAMTPI